MVLYFTSNVIDPPAMIYMGKDKFENEDLIKYGFPEDFHVDKLSSAHVYVRLEPGQSWDQIPEALLQDCAQLVKANSIEGNKKDNVAVVYTPWENLKKTAGMEVGQVSFNKQNLVKRIHIQTRVNAIVNRLNRTKQELYPDLAEQRVERDKSERLVLRKAELKKREEEDKLAEERRKAKQDIDNLFSEANMTSNYRESEVEDVNAWEEDFM